MEQQQKFQNDTKQQLEKYEENIRELSERKNILKKYSAKQLNSMIETLESEKENLKREYQNYQSEVENKINKYEERLKLFEQENTEGTEQFNQKIDQLEKN